MTTELLVNPIGLSKEQLDLIEQFEADYNAVDHFLRKSIGADKQISFSQLVKEYSNKHKGWGDADLLKTLAEIRNAIIHNKTRPYRYLAVPTLAISQELTACLNRLINPARAIPTFQHKVETISIDDTLARVLKVIRQCNFSQFPVYDTQRFLGLLTENGITCWLALYVSNKDSLVELEDASVREVLKREEERPNSLFLPRDIPIDEVKGAFASHKMLEAVLFTATGKDSEKLLGIATRWDIIKLI